ncbi:hypothetical protein As57867_007565, partial [Aphanomyces stellatus]
MYSFHNFLCSVTKAEFFDNKMKSLGFPPITYAIQRGLSLNQFVQNMFLLYMAMNDAAIVTWSNKFQYDTVRPFSLVRNFYKGQTVTAWAGPGIGKVTNLPAQDWRSYLNTAPHPDYPSASSCFCAAQMEAMRLFYKTDNFGYSYQWMAGSSTVEPGLTPKTTLTLGPW